MNNFKPPWDYFPIHETRTGKCKASIEVGFDQGENMTFGVGFWDEKGIMSGWTFSGPEFKQAILDYLDMISLARFVDAKLLDT